MTRSYEPDADRALAGDQDGPDREDQVWQDYAYAVAHGYGDDWLLSRRGWLPPRLATECTRLRQLVTQIRTMQDDPVFARR